MTTHPWIAAVFRYVDRRAEGVLILVILAGVIGGTGSWHWFPELFSHFFFQYALLLPPLAFFLFWRRTRRWRWEVPVALAFAGWVLVLPWLPGSGPPGRQELVLFQFNAARNTAPLASWLGQHHREVDVVLVLEAGPAFAADMEALATAFPHRVAQLDDSPFGIALLSRHPLHGAQTLDIIGPDFPALQADVIVPGSPLRVIGIHPPPPLGSALAGLRDRFMRTLARRMDRDGPPAIVFGDFNSTVWSPQLRAFMAATGLKDAQRGHGALGTWPAMSARYAGFAGIPIDLALVSANVRVVERRAGPDLGSDHLPVLTRIAY